MSHSQSCPLIISRLGQRTYTRILVLKRGWIIPGGGGGGVAGRGGDNYHVLHGPDHNIDDLFYRTVLFPPRPMAKAAVLQDYCNSKLAHGTVNDRAAVNPMLTRQQSSVQQGRRGS